MPKVLLLRAELLPASETFIAAQAAALRRYEPGFVALKRVSGGLDVPAVVAVLDDRAAWRGKAARHAYARTGIAPRYQQKLAKWKPDIAHVHFATDACAFLPLLRRLDVPFVVTLHGYDVGLSDAAHAQSALGRTFLRRREALWREATVFLCVSEHLRRVAMERGFPKDRLSVHYTGIPVRPYTPHEHARGPLVLFVGRLVEKKGCQFLLEAMARVAWEIPNVRLAVIGDGPLRAELEACAGAKLRRCEFLGVQTQAEVRGWMERAAVLAVPSIRAKNGDTEGLPTVVLEAMERGLPVVASNGTGAEEAVVAGETGFITAQSDAGGLAEALICLLRNGNEARRLGANGRRRVEERFDIVRQTELLEKIYDALGGGRG